MAYHTIKFAALVCALSLPLIAFVTDASAASTHSRTMHRASRAMAPAEEPIHSIARPPSAVGGTIYLNGWSSSDNPEDCNKGCVNSNGG